MTNKGKYETRNPAKRWLLGRFVREAARRIEDMADGPILDVGTGEGLFWRSGFGRASNPVVGVDIRHDALKEAGGLLRGVRASVTALPFAESSFDVVVAMEILEHVEDPDAAIREIRRVARRDVLITVPWEPWFSLGVLLGTGRHLLRWGREPEHVQAFNPRTIRLAVAAHFADVTVETCAPWLMVRASVGSSR